VVLIRLLTPVIVCVVDIGDENEQREWEGVVKANANWNSVNDPQIKERNSTKFIVFVAVTVAVAVVVSICCSLTVVCC